MRQILFLFAFVLTAVGMKAQPVPVIITAGQSNADGRVPVEELPDDIKQDGYAYCQWSYGSGDFRLATGQFEPFRPTVGRTNLGDRWAFDAVVYHELEQSLKKPFFVIKETMGGTAIDTACTQSTHGKYWSADPIFLQSTKAAGRGGRSLLKSLTEHIDLCIDSVLSKQPGGYDIRCLLWHQGESDKPQAGRYEENLRAVIAYVRRHLVEKTGCERYATLPVICGNFAKNSRQGSPQVAKAMRRLAESDGNVYVVDATDLTLQRDQLHFDAQGAEQLGKRYFEQMKILGLTQ